MRILAAIFGVLLITIILWDAFETVILPRRVTRRIRLTSVFYSSIWVPWSLFVRHITTLKRSEKYLSLFGPLSLLMLLVIWAFGLILGYALIFWSVNAKVIAIENVSFWTHFYLSGVTFFTLGYGDVAPIFPLGRFFAVVEAANGFGLLAIVISYLPILYQAFSRREASISLLDARAGSPSSAVELLRRHRAEDTFDDLNRLLSEWERWSAELLESHLSYPVLCYFRSQHDKTKPSSIQCCETRLPSAELVRLRLILKENGIQMSEGPETERRLLELRLLYEPYVAALSEWLMMPLPPWILPPDAIDNWKTSAWGRIQ